MLGALNKKYIMGLLKEAIVIFKKVFIYFIGKKFITGVVFGCGLIGLGFNIFIMDINDIGRWISYNKIPNQEKVQRVFDYDELIKKKDLLIEGTGKLKEEKVSLEVALKKMSMTLEAKEEALKKKNEKIKQLEKKNNELRDKTKSESEQTLKIPFDEEIILVEGRAKRIVLNNIETKFKLIHALTGGCNIEILLENIELLNIRDKSPKKFLLNEKKYIIRYVGSKYGELCRIKITID